MAESKHFKNHELRCQGRNCCGHANLCRPELLEALEAFRSLIGQPVFVTSGYRCPEHNRAIGGAQNSQHKVGRAADIRVPGFSAAQLQRAAEQVPEIRGIGRDDFGRFLHLDVREGERVYWCYDEHGKTVAYYDPVVT